MRAALTRNAALSFRRNKKHDYLLRCLLKCGNCGLGIHGCVFPGSAKRRPWRYYRCSGKDPLTRARATKCPRACIDADALDQVVWDHVAGLVGTPLYSHHKDDLWNYFYRGICAFGFAAKAFGDEKLFASIREFRDDFAKRSGKADEVSSPPET